MSIENKLTDYLFGEITGAEAEQIHAHLEQCSRCRELFTGLQEAVCGLREAALPAGEPDALTEAQREAILARAAKADEAGPAGAWQLLPKRFVLRLAAVIVIAFAAWATLRPMWTEHVQPRGRGEDRIATYRTSTAAEPDDTGAAATLEETEEMAVSDAPAVPARSLSVSPGESGSEEEATPPAAGPAPAEAIAHLDEDMERPATNVPTAAGEAVDSRLRDAKDLAPATVGEDRPAAEVEVAAQPPLPKAPAHVEEPAATRPPVSRPEPVLPAKPADMAAAKAIAAPEPEPPPEVTTEPEPARKAQTEVPGRQESAAGDEVKLAMQAADTAKRRAQPLVASFVIHNPQAAPEKKKAESRARELRRDAARTFEFQDKAAPLADAAALPARQPEAEAPPAPAPVQVVHTMLPSPLDPDARVLVMVVYFLSDTPQAKARLEFNPAEVTGSRQLVPPTPWSVAPNAVLIAHEFSPTTELDTPATLHLDGDGWTWQRGLSMLQRAELGGERHRGIQIALLNGYARLVGQQPDDAPERTRLREVLEQFIEQAPDDAPARQAMELLDALR